jgi:hypothetical protein
MNIDIKKILEKYYAGTTSLEEEKQLRDFFASPNMEESYLPEKKMFELFMLEKQETEISSAKHFLRKISPVKRKLFSQKKLLHFTSGITACLVFTIGIIFYQQEQKNTAYVVINGIRINDKELAIESVNGNLTRVSAIIDKSLASLNKIKMMENKLDSIINID